jgi:hypothetical protein
MAKRITTRLVVATLILVVTLLGVHAASHWDSHSSDDQQCQVCHIGHAAIPQPAAVGTELALVMVARFSAAERSSPHFDAVPTPGVPRAPPV